MSRLKNIVFFGVQIAGLLLTLGGVYIFANRMDVWYAVGGTMMWVGVVVMLINIAWYHNYGRY